MADLLGEDYGLVAKNALYRCYRDPRWPQLDDVSLHMDALRTGLRDHFDTIDMASDLETEQLRQKINSFLQT
jgi:hypothetical protein